MSIDKKEHEIGSYDYKRRDDRSIDTSSHGFSDSFLYKVEIVVKYVLLILSACASLSLGWALITLFFSL